MTLMQFKEIASFCAKCGAPWLPWMMCRRRLMIGACTSPWFTNEYRSLKFPANDPI